MKFCEILRQPQECFLKSKQGKQLVAECDTAFRAVHGDRVLLPARLDGVVFTASSAKPCPDPRQLACLSGK